MTTYTDTIGSVSAGHGGDGDFATLALWHGTSATVPVSGDVMVVQFLSGAHDIGGLYNNFNEVDFDIVFQAHPSALHNGDWDAGASIDLSSGNCFMNYFGDQTLSITFEDLLFKYTQGSRQFYLGHQNSTSGSCAQFSSTLTLNRCMLTHTSSIVNQPREFISYYIGFEDVDASGNVSALGKNTFNINNCVIVGSREYKFLTYSNQDQAFDFEFNVKGTTIDNTVANIAGVLRPSGNTKGSVDSYFTANFEGTLLPDRPVHYNSFRDYLPSATRAFTFTDYIYSRPQSEMEGYLDGGSTNPPTFTYNNASFSVPFNYDGTVTSGEVCFVGPSGHEGNYRLVADLDNLPVRHIDTSKPSFLGRRDVAGEPRPGLMDAGAFQSISTNVSSFEIGSSSAGHIKDGTYATVSLWYTNERDSLLNGDTVNLEFLSGAPHSIGGPYYDSFNEVNFNLKFKPASSAIHNGNWDEGVAIDLNTGNFLMRLGDQSVKVEIEDLIFSSAGGAAAYFYNTNATPSSCGSYDFEIKNNRCLISTPQGPFRGSYGLETRDSLGNLTELGNYTYTFENSVFDSTDNYFTYFGPLHDHQCNVTFNFIGSTIWGKTIYQGYGLTRISTNSASGADSTLTHTFKGLLSNFSLTHWNSLNSSPNLQKKVYNIKDSILAIGNLSSTTSITASGTYDLHNNTNIATNELGSFDGTVTSGQVNFVDNGGVTALRDYRLVPDLDNLPVKYMTSGELSYKDITGYKRPGGTDQRDAGAFQSISDQVLINKIGTSSVDFPAEYASMYLWSTNEFDSENILNGTTHVLQFKEGEEYSLADNIYMHSISNLDNNRNVNQSFIFSGNKPHNGDWNSGAKIIDQTGTTFSPGLNSIDITYKDLIYDSSSSTIVGNANRLNYFQNNMGNSNSDNWTSVAPIHSFNYENFMVRTDVSNTSLILGFDQNYGVILDDDGNILERGESRSTHKNCLYIGAGCRPVQYGYGSINMFNHQYGTNCKGIFNVEGCTLINAFINNSRHNASPRLEFSCAGSVVYMLPGALNQFSRSLGLLHEANNGSTDTSAITVKDCIFNKGAGDSIVSPSYQDRYSLWFTEPLSSEYYDSTSATVIAYQTWVNREANNSNVTLRVPFNFDGSVSAGTVSFVSADANDYTLVADADNLAVRYMDLSSIVTARDIANVKRCGSTDAGAFQSVSNRVLSATIPTEYASFEVFAGALGVGEFLNGDTFHIKYEDGVHNSFGYVYTTNADHTAGREVDLNIIVEGENHHQGYWSSGAIFRALGTMSHGRQTTSYLWKNIVIDNDNHPNWPYRHYKYAGDVTNAYGHNLNQYETDEVYDDTITFENCLIRMKAYTFIYGIYDSSIDDRPNEHPKSDPNTNTLNYSNSLSNIVKAGTISTNYKNCVIESLRTDTIPLALNVGTVPSFLIRKVSLVGCSVKDVGIVGGLTWPSESTVELSGCLIDTSGVDYFIRTAWHGSTFLEQQPHFTWTDCIFTDTSSNADLFILYNYQIPAGSGALENSIASGYINNCTFGIPFHYDNEAHDGAVTFIGSALDPTGPLDFRLGGNPRVRTNLAEGYIPSQEDFGEPGEPGAFAYDYYLVKGIQLSKIPQSTIAYKVDIRKQ